MRRRSRPTTSLVRNTMLCTAFMRLFNAWQEFLCWVCVERASCAILLKACLQTMIILRRVFINRRRSHARRALGCLRGRCHEKPRSTVLALAAAVIRAPSRAFIQSCAALDPFWHAVPTKSATSSQHWSTARWPNRFQLRVRLPDRCRRCEWCHWVRTAQCPHHLRAAAFSFSWSLRNFFDEPPRKSVHPQE